MKQILAVLFILSSILAHSGRAHAAKDEIIFTFVDSKPISYIDKDGNVKGIIVDTIEEVLTKRLGLNVKYIELPWKRAQNAVKMGLADFFVTVPTIERLEYALAGKVPFFNLDIIIYTYSGHSQLNEIKKITSIEDIKRLQLKAVTNLGNGWHEENIQAKGVETYIAPRDENILSILAHKRADIMIDSDLSMDPMIKSKGFDQEITKIDTAFNQVAFYLMMNKKSHYINLMPKIDQALQDAIHDGTIKKIKKSYHE